MTEGTVYVVQEPPPFRRGGRLVAKDLSSAQRYGKLVTILANDDQPSLTPGPALHELSKALRQFNPSTDYLCWAGGDPMSMALAIVALKEQGVHYVPTLRWERERDNDGQRTRGGFYVPIEVPTRL